MKVKNILVFDRGGVQQVLVGFDVIGPDNRPLTASFFYGATGDRNPIIQWAEENAPGIEVEFANYAGEDKREINR